MKALFYFYLILLPICISAQQSFITLYSQSYKEIRWNKPIKKINSPLSFTYSKYNSLIVFKDRSVTFRNALYRQDSEDSAMVETINCAEGEGFNAGYYSISIRRDIKGTSFQIMLSNGTTFFVEKSKVYCENGGVTSNVYIKNFKQKNILDSINQIKQKLVSDSLAKLALNNNWVEFYEAGDVTKEPQADLIHLLTQNNVQDYQYHFYHLMTFEKTKYYVVVGNGAGDWRFYYVNTETKKIDGPHRGEAMEFPYPVIIR